MSAATRTCPSCGSLLSRFNRAMVCASCARRPYDPFTDPDFADDVIRDLLAHPDEWRHPGRIVAAFRGGTCEAQRLAWSTWKAVQLARRLGHVIDGDTAAGYCWRDWSMRGKVRPRNLESWLDWSQRSDDHNDAGHDVIPGQLRIG